MTLLAGLLPTASGQQGISVSSRIENQNGKSYYMHTVLAGQTLYSISKTYKTDIETILFNNPEARTGLKVNQVLRIPALFNPHLPAEANQIPKNEAPITETHDYIYHVAGKNNTFKYIADIYVVSENLIRAANPGLSEPITEGEYVVVPIAPKSATLDTRTLANRPDLIPYEVPASRKTETPSAISTDKPQKKPVVSEQKSTQAPSNQNLTASTSASSVIPQTIKTEVVPSRQDVSQVSIVPIIWPAVDYNRHTVKEKETLFSIARAYNIRVSEIRQLNPGLSDTLQPGQILLLPATAQPTASAFQESSLQETKIGTPTPVNVETPQNNKNSDQADTLKHTVKSGETLYRIAIIYGLSVDEIKRLNPGLNEFIRPGQKILVTKKKIAPEYILHEIEYPERAEELAEKYGLKLIDLQRMNPRMGKRLKSGEKIRIPVNRTAHDLIKDSKDGLEATLVNDAVDDDIRRLSSSCEQSFAFKNKTFRVALLIPFFLEEKEDFSVNMTPETDLESFANLKEFTFMGFYEGFLIAADSLAKTKGLSIELSVMDVDQDLNKTKNAIEAMEDKKPDLIVGPFYSKPFEHIARYSRDHNILIINPLAQRNEILSGFPNVVKVKPAAETQLDFVAAAIKQYYPKARVFIYSPGSGKYSGQVEALKQRLEQLLPSTVKISNEEMYQLAVERTSGRRQPVVKRQITVEGRTFQTDWLQAHKYDSTTFDNPVMAIRYSQDSIRMVQQLASKVRDNIVIAYADDNVFAMELMNKLNQLTDTATIRLFGLPNWDRFENLFPENLLNLRVHYTVQSHVDYQDYFTEQFIYHYRTRFKNEPDQYAFEGFDIAWYFLQSLMQFDKSSADCIPTFMTELLQSDFLFRKSNPQDGLENIYWNTYRIDRYRLTDMPVMVRPVDKGR